MMKSQLHEYLDMHALIFQSTIHSPPPLFKQVKGQKTKKSPILLMSDISFGHYFSYLGPHDKHTLLFVIGC